MKEYPVKSSKEEIPSNCPTLDSKKIDTIFVQGIFRSITHLAQYIGNNEIKLPTGEHMSCTSKNILTIFNPFIGPELAEVNMEPFSGLDPTDWVMGYIINAANKYYGISITQTDNNDNSGKTYKYTATRVGAMNFGQELNIQSLHHQYLAWKEQRYAKDESRGIALYGTSRGGPTVVSTFCEYQYEEVKIVIAESCFYSMEDLLERRFSSFSKISSNLLSSLTQYRSDGPSASKYIDKFPEGIPIVFITSEKDQIVPAASVIKLALELANKGRNPVYLNILKDSPHQTYMSNNDSDRNRYQNLINAVYRKYECEHNTDLADKGESLLEECLLRGDGEERHFIIRKLRDLLNEPENSSNKFMLFSTPAHRNTAAEALRNLMNQYENKDIDTKTFVIELTKLKLQITEGHKKESFFARMGFTDAPLANAIQTTINEIPSWAKQTCDWKKLGEYQDEARKSIYSTHTL